MSDIEYTYTMKQKKNYLASKRVLVFKTSVEGNTHKAQLTPALNSLLWKKSRWNFDLDDCDRILRVETPAVQADEIIELLNRQGFACQELMDEVVEGPPVRSPEIA